MREGLLAGMQHKKSTVFFKSFNAVMNNLTHEKNTRFSLSFSFISYFSTPLLLTGP